MVESSRKPIYAVLAVHTSERTGGPRFAGCRGDRPWPQRRLSHLRPASVQKRGIWPCDRQRNRSDGKSGRAGQVGAEYLRFAALTGAFPVQCRKDCATGQRTRGYRQSGSKGRAAGCGTGISFTSRLLTLKVAPIRIPPETV